MSRNPRILIAAAALSLAACLKPPCPLTQTQCTNDGKRYCTDLSVDEYNCGACGAVCGPGLTCTSGVCVVVCPNDLSTCLGVGDGGAYCADVLTDSLNCGACGAACPGGQACAGGSCAPSCAAGLTSCGSTCTDVTADPLNCGGCGQACPGAQPCVAGVCGGVCPAGATCPAGCAQGQVACASRASGQSFCVDPQSDSFNCGACGAACPAGEACVAGACACAPGFTSCGLADGTTACVDLVTDVDNCGACGQVCPAGSTCNNACLTIGLAQVSSPTVSGDVATLLGTGFDPTATVLFGRAPATVLAATSVRLDVTVPPGVSGPTAVTVSVGGALSNPVVADVWGSTAPVHVSGQHADCTTAASNTGRKIAVDGEGTIYVGFQCGPADAGADYVAVSADYGHTFHETRLPLDGYLELGLQAGPPGTLFAAAFTPQSALAYLYTTDYGLTWSAPVILDSQLVAPPVVSLAYLDGKLQISASEATRVVLFTSSAPTSGLPFVGTSSSQLGVQFFDVLLDPFGPGFVAGDFSSVLIQPEVDGGLGSLPAPTSPSGAAIFYSDWALGPSDAGSVLYGGGLSSFPLAAPAAAVAVFTSDLATAYPYTGMEPVDAPQTAAVTADVAGNGYLVAQSLGGIAVQQLPYAGTAASAPVVVAARGRWPVLAPGLGQSVVMGYADPDGGIEVAVQTFP